MTSNQKKATSKTLYALFLVNAAKSIVYNLNIFGTAMRAAET